MCESEWIRGFIRSSDCLIKDSLEGNFKYVPEIQSIPYSIGIPPEYKNKYLTGEEIIPDESDNIYCFLIYQYREITGDYPPINHSTNKNWYFFLLKMTENWNNDSVDAFAKIFIKGTLNDKSKRFQSIEEIQENEHYKNLLKQGRN